MNSWYEKHWWQKPFLPLAYLFQQIVALRLKAYQANWFKRFKSVDFPAPIIIVGNVTAGGTGKTPFVIWLVNLLKQHGFKPGIVSRGYKSHGNKYPYLVTIDNEPDQVGDEALLLAQTTHVPIMIGPKRSENVAKLLQETHCDIVISDDGLQHYALARDLEIVMLDGERGFGNGYLLPVGPLREPLSRLETVDFVVGKNFEQHVKSASLIPFLQRGKLSPSIFPEKIIPMKTQLGEAYQLQNPENIRALHTFSERPVHAIAGIGSPESFFQQLRDQQLTIIPHVFPDHYAYCQKDFAFLEKDSDHSNAQIILMTEKDAVKCKVFANAAFWVLPLAVELPESFAEEVMQKIHKISKTKLGSVCNSPCSNSQCSNSR